MTPTPPSLPFTGDPAADRLISTDPLALLIGFVLDQQVSVQKAFAGPLELQRRLGPLDASLIAGMDAADLEAAFTARPALHRFPAAMARRVQELCMAIVQDYDGHAERIWRDAADGADLEARLLALPGIGEMKAHTIIAVLGRRLGVSLPGLEAVMPRHATLGDVDSEEALAAYQAHKRARKRELREASATSR
jgi:uncharacterized HhH-GPD family protein